MQSQTKNNTADLINKIGILDMMLESMGKIHKDDSEKIDVIIKRISSKKLVLMDELLKVLSHLTV